MNFIIHNKNYFITVQHIVCSVMFVSICFGCGNSNNNIVFDVGFEPHRVGIIYDSVQNRELIFFDKRTAFAPEIAFFDLRGNLVKRSKFEQIYQKMGKSQPVGIISLDSIYFYNLNEITIAVTDTNENKIVSTTLDPNLAIKDNGEKIRYDIYAARVQNDLSNTNNGNFYFYLFFIDNDSTRKMVKEIRSKNKRFYDTYHKGINDNALVCSISRFPGEKPTVKTGLDGFYNTLSGSSHSTKAYFSASSFPVMVNQRLFFVDKFSRDLLELNPTDLTISEKIRVIPDNMPVPVGIDIPDNIEIGAVSEQLDSLIYQAKQENEKSFIINLLYDKYKKRYFVFVKNGVPNGEYYKTTFPFVIYIYDDDFNMIGEKHFDNDRYFPIFSIMTSKGLLIEKRSKDYDYKKSIYEYIEI